MMCITASCKTTSNTEVNKNSAPNHQVKQTAPKTEVKPEKNENPIVEKNTQSEAKTDGTTVDYEATKEEYEAAFEEIDKLINKLNTIIKNGRYEEWLTYLTEEYINTMSKKSNLEEISDKPILKRYNINLHSLRDYFNYVVVPSRSNTQLDDIIFVDKKHVKAISVKDGKNTILYQLERVNDKWKIGIW